MKLKLQVEEIEKQLFNQKLFEEMIDAKQSTVNSVFENIFKFELYFLILIYNCMLLLLLQKLYTNKKIMPIN